MNPPLVRYRSPDEDSARWSGFPFRDGDIVISTRSKNGTTWMQMICALFVFRSMELPASLPHLSPWLDWLIEPQHEVVERLEAQAHRRFIKTHTPLDGVPLDRRASYIVVARHPLDAALSLYYQGSNLDRGRIAELTSRAGGSRAADAGERKPQLNRPDAASWLRSWIENEAEPGDELDSPRGVFHHLTDAWARRHDDNVVLVHYDDLIADLDGEMRKLAAVLGFAAADQHDPAIWPALVAAARFDAMSNRAELLAPDPLGILKDRSRFFRGGRSGDGARVLEPADLARYHRRAAKLAPPDLLAWLDRRS